MKEVVVLSGKGGTGKTSIVASLAATAQGKVLADCDVDNAGLYLLLKHTVKKEDYFWSGQFAFIDSGLCIRCGLCQKNCRFNAISHFSVVTLACEGCGFCAHICPVEAISMKDNLSGRWFISETGYGALVHARLGVARENSGQLVALVRQKARQIAEEQGLEYIISDGPRGTGAPVGASLSGASLALIVAEPSLAALEYLKRVLALCCESRVPVMVCLNKYDLNADNNRQIEDYCYSQGLKIAARIPFDTAFSGALGKGLPVVEYATGRISLTITSMWQLIGETLVA